MKFVDEDVTVATPVSHLQEVAVVVAAVVEQKRTPSEPVQVTGVALDGVATRVKYSPAPLAVTVGAASSAAAVVAVARILDRSAAVLATP